MFNVRNYVSKLEYPCVSMSDPSESMSDPSESMSDPSIGTASVEQSFSQIEVIKSRLRNHLGEVYLSHL